MGNNFQGKQCACSSRKKEEIHLVATKVLRKIWKERLHGRNRTEDKYQRKQNK